MVRAPVHLQRAFGVDHNGTAITGVLEPTGVVLGLYVVPYVASGLVAERAADKADVLPTQVVPRDELIQVLICVRA